MTRSLETIYLSRSRCRTAFRLSQNHQAMSEDKSKVRQFFDDLIDDAKDFFKSLWNGTTVVQKNAAQIDQGLDQFEDALESSTAQAIVDIIPGKIDNNVRQILLKGARTAQPYVDAAVDFNKCLDEDMDDVEQIACIIEKVRDLKKEDREEVRRSLGINSLQQVMKEATGKWMDADKAEKAIDGARSAKEAARDLME